MWIESATWATIHLIGPLTAPMICMELKSSQKFNHVSLYDLGLTF